MVFTLLIMRCVLDIIFPGTKPGIAVMLYLLLTVGVMVMEMVRANATGFDYTLSLLLPVTTVASILNAPLAIPGQINFGSQCFIPVMFLLLISRSRSVDFDRLRRLFVRYGMVIIFVCLAYALRSHEDPDVDALEFLNDNPMHSTAQLLAKAALVLVGPLVSGSWIALAGTFVTIGAIAALNVRSTMLGIIIGLVTVSRRFLLLCVLCVVVLAALAYVDMGLINGFFDRLLFKGRDFLGDSVGNLTSGRIDRIWPFYIERLTEASFLELLFGQGALWLFSEMALFAHNDFLTITVAYGLVGLVLYSVAWFLILSRIARPYRYPSIVMFLILVTTNGVVSYQSNVLFALFYGGGIALSGRDRGRRDVPVTEVAEAAASQRSRDTDK